MVTSSVLLHPSIYDFKMHFVFAGMETQADVLTDICLKRVNFMCIIKKECIKDFFILIPSPCVSNIWPFHLFRCLLRMKQLIYFT